MKSIHRCRKTLPLLTSSMLLAPLATAQSEGATDWLEEVVVTAQKKTETVLEVAATINVIQSQTIDDFAVFNFQDTEKLLAGVDFFGAGGFDSKISVRGIGNYTISGLDPAVAVFIDGIYQPDSGALFATLNDVAAIELLRGPQGTLYGANAPAGAINITTQAPNFEGVSGGIGGNYFRHKERGNDGSEVRGHINLPLVKDALALRVSATQLQDDGYIYNAGLGQKASDAESTAARARLLWQPGDNFSALAGYSWSRSNAGAYRHRFDGSPELDYDIFDNVTYEDNPSRAEDTLRQADLTLEWQFGGHTLTSISGYVDYDQYGRRDEDGHNYQQLGQQQISDTTLDRSSFMQELRLASNGDGPLNYMVGLYFMRRDENVRSIIVSPGALDRLQYIERISDSQAAFGSATWDINDRWALTAGLRYSVDTRTSDTVAQQTTILGEAPPESLSDKNNYYNTSASLKLQYFASDSTMLYASLDRAYRPGGINFIVPESYRVNGLADYESETAHAVELGFKSEWLGGTLQSSFAIFYQQMDSPIQAFLVTAEAFASVQPLEDQGYLLVDPIPVPNVLQNAGSAVSQGAELEIGWYPSPHFYLRTSMAYNDYTFDDYENAVTTFFLSPDVETVPASDLNPFLSGLNLVDMAEYPGMTALNFIPTRDLSGADVQGLPKFSANLLSEYRVPLGSAPMDWYIRGLVVHRGDTSSASGFSGTDPFTTLDLFLGLAGGNWDVSLWAKNATDEQAWTEREDGRDGTITGTSKGRTAAPRTIGVGFAYSF